MVFRYLNFQARETHWKLAIETWAMIAFISIVLSYTGLVESPLLNLYLLVIIACAITLGKIMTLLEVMLIACCYLYMSYLSYPTGLFAPETFTMLMAKFSPFLLVAYVTSMLASDILYAQATHHPVIKNRRPYRPAEYAGLQQYPGKGNRTCYALRTAVHRHHG